MQDYSNTNDKHLTLTERRQIERWHNKDKLNNRRIAQLLNKAIQTINNELRKEKVHLKIKANTLRIKHKNTTEPIKVTLAVDLSLRLTSIKPFFQVFAFDPLSLDK
ncbi:IS30 family transposase [Lactovum miscens]|uniref:IS30 family transposase n=1 Tax=Lactovum miscens TaxID=190387 RepID=A0A841C9U9_9LACT|nr:helix-turn-helix domain-containing protein [Lactovum miscens]MBB5888341.1 IS30 family transposase [Lactovum miscens]